jgi:hypothetical protein
MTEVGFWAIFARTSRVFDFLNSFEIFQDLGKEEVVKIVLKCGLYIQGSKEE